MRWEIANLQILPGLIRIATFRLLQRPNDGSVLSSPSVLQTDALFSNTESDFTPGVVRTVKQPEGCGPGAVSLH